MIVPIGDAKTRGELLKDNGNMDLERDGFLEGRNDPADIDGMISLFVRFNNVSYIKKAIVIWGDAQDVALRLLPVAETLRQEIHSPNPSVAKINELLASIYAINEHLTV